MRKVMETQRELFEDNLINCITICSDRPLGLQIYGGELGFSSPAVYAEANDNGSPTRTPIALDNPKYNQGFLINACDITYAKVNNILVWNICTLEDPMEAKGIVELGLLTTMEITNFVNKFRQQIEAMGFCINSI